MTDSQTKCQNALGLQMKLSKRKYFMAFYDFLPKPYFFYDFYSHEFLENKHFLMIFMMIIYYLNEIMFLNKTNLTSLLIVFKK